MEIPIEHNGNKLVGFVSIKDPELKKDIRNLQLTIRESYLKNKDGQKELLNFHTCLFTEYEKKIKLDLNQVLNPTQSDFQKSQERLKMNAKDKQEIVHQLLCSNTDISILKIEEFLECLEDMELLNEEGKEVKHHLWDEFIKKEEE